MLQRASTEAPPSPQHQIWMKLVTLSCDVPCEALRLWLEVTIRDVSSAIVEGAGDWGDFDWQKHQDSFGGGDKKRRRTDYHVRQYAIQTTVLDGCCKSASRGVKSLPNVCQSTGVRWVQSEAAAYRAETWLRFRNVDQLSISVDASRVCKPARDCLIAPISAPAEGHHGVLPPAVRRGMFESCVGTWGRLPSGIRL